MCEAILIRCDLYHGSGAGHLKRCLVLSEALKDQGFTPIMVLDRDSGPLPFEVNVIVERISTHSYDQPTDVPVLAKLAVHYGARKVIVDSYRFFRSWVRELQAEGLSVILIDDLHIGADADLAIDYSPAALLSGPNSLNRLCGPSYFITDSNIIAYSKGTPRKMVLHAGGTGGFEAAPCVYAAAIRMAREHGLNVSWICPTVSGRDWLKHSELASSDDTVLSWINDPGNLWSEFDFVIGPSSTSLFEAVMQGSLPISFSISDTQLSESIDWSRIGHVLHLAQSEINDAKALNTIMSLAFEYFQELRSELSKHSHLLDGNGAFRVAKAIANLPNKPNSPPNLTGSRSEEMIRECNLTDAVAFLQARNGISVRALSTNPDQIIKWPDHLSWWLQKTVERFVLEDNNEIIAYFWHRSKKVAGHDYLIGGWFPASDRPSFTAAVRLLHWQLEYCANKYPGHLWIATINKRNRAVLSLNRRCGFTDADPFNIEVAKELFPGTSDDFQCLQRTSKL